MWISRKPSSADPRRPALAELVLAPAILYPILGPTRPLEVRMVVVDGGAGGASKPTRVDIEGVCAAEGVGESRSVGCRGQA